MERALRQYEGLWLVIKKKKKAMVRYNGGEPEQRRIRKAVTKEKDLDADAIAKSHRLVVVHNAEEKTITFSLEAKNILSNII